MTDHWSDGYVTEIGYTYGYYQETNPLRACLPLLVRGFRPQLGGTHCELGFGQGLSININAAASGDRWFGTDFNPAQFAHANWLSEASGAALSLANDAFQDFCSRADLPDFDSVHLHGIWSWIDDKSRQVVTDFLARKLKPGGLLYLSYNTQPGWAAMVPLREMMRLHTERVGAPGGPLPGKIRESVAFAEKLLECSPAFAQASPSLVERLKKIKQQDPKYLAHEYFNKSWEPFSFPQVADQLREAKLDYAVSAQYVSNVDSLNFSQAQSELLAGMTDPVLNQYARDMMLNTQFRKDYWIKGGMTLSPLEQTQALKDLQFVRLVELRPQDFKLKTPRGTVNLNANLYNLLAEAFMAAGTLSIGELSQQLKGQFSLTQVVQGVTIMVAAGWIDSVQPVPKQQAAAASSAALNRALLARNLAGGGYAHLASPVLGGGVMVPVVDQLLLSALEAGQTDQATATEFAWKALAQGNRKLTKDGTPITDVSAARAFLGEQAATFFAQRLPVYTLLKIAE